jgi:hypothetical protein
VKRATRLATALLAGQALTTAGAADARWCLSMSGLGAVRAGMTVDEVLPMLDWSGLERPRRAVGCWYLEYQGPDAFALMIIDNRVARIELRRKSRLQTFAGAHLGATEVELRRLYGSRLEMQPHKYVDGGHVFVLRSGAGTEGLRFETAAGVVTAIQAGPWEHLNYVEGCS